MSSTMGTRNWLMCCSCWRPKPNKRKAILIEDFDRERRRNSENETNIEERTFLKESKSEKKTIKISDNLKENLKK